MSESEAVDLASTLVRHAAAASSKTTTSPASGAERYTLGRELGRGGMGRVVEAIDRQFERVVAVKELLGTRDDDSLARFETEALVTGHLEHPGIPAVHERGLSSSGSPYYVMQRVSGRTLTAAVAAAPQLTARLALVPAVVKVAHTLGFAHSRGVVHRDLKPDNVMLGVHGEVSVLDWGIAKVKGVGDGSGPSVTPLAGSGFETRAGALMGTPAFMSPEQARGDVQHIDERTDVFALGALLFYVLAGRHPYTGTTLAELLEQARNGTMLPLDGEVPPALREICLRALATDPKDRFANATELANALEASTAEALAGGRGAVRWLTGGLSVLAMLGLLSVMVSAWRFSPSFEALGNSALFLIMLSAAGLGLSATELWTGGRHRLSSLALAVAMATVVLTPAVTGIAAQQVVGTLKGTRDTALARHVQANPDEFATHVLEGAHELLGLPPFGFSLAALQLLVWGVARRRAESLTSK